MPDIAAALAASVIKLYPVVDSGGTVRLLTGDLGGRVGADALCAASPNRPVATNSRVGLLYRALISTAADDEVRDFVTR